MTNILRHPAASCTSSPRFVISRRRFWTGRRDKRPNLSRHFRRRWKTGSIPPHLSFALPSLTKECSRPSIARYLDELTPLLHAVRVFEVVYVATSKHNFPEADAIFQLRFAPAQQQRQQAFDDFRAGPSARRVGAAIGIQPTFVTLIFRYSYPKFLRNEALGSARGSGVERGPSGSTAYKQKTSANDQTIAG